MRSFMQPEVRGQSYGLVLDFITCAVVSVSITSIALLISNVFSPKIAVFSGLAIALLVFASFKEKIRPISNPSCLGFFAIGALIIFTLIFRIDPYPWINGGQDQGVYVSMSAYYQNGGDIFIEDNVLPHLTANEVKNTYLDSRRDSRRKGSFHPGVYYGGEKDYVFQFYHLHPLWMANFAEFFGDNARTYSVIFFGLLSIVFLTLLAFELSQSRFTALAVGVMLAVNPLHAFFSKWPVTEIVALGFSSMAFYYLARAYRLSAQPAQSKFALSISCLSLTLLFFTRISGFLYLPGLFLLFLVGAWLCRVKNERFGLDLVLFVSITIATYILSVFYGLKFSPNYSIDIYRKVFGKIPGVDWSWMFAGGVASMLLLMVVFYALCGLPKFSSAVNAFIHPRFLIRAMLILLITMCAVSLYKVYLVAYTDAYASDSWLGQLWKLSGSDIQAVMRSSVLNWLLYTSPFLVFGGLCALLWRKLDDVKVSLLFAMLVVGLGAVILKHPILPYQYYYARYLLSEAVPFGIVVFSVAILGSKSPLGRRVGVVLVALSIITFSFFTLKQFGAEEGKRPLHVIKSIASHVDDNDVLLIEPKGWQIPRFGIETPLRFYFGLKTFALDSSARNLSLNSLKNDFRNIWLLSPKRVDSEDFLLVERLEHFDKVMERSGHVPLKIIDGFWRQELYLYVMKKAGWPSMDGRFVLKKGTQTVEFGRSNIEFLLGEGWHHMEKKHVWSTPEAEFRLRAEMFEGNSLPDAITVHFRPFAANKERPVTLHVSVCGQGHQFTYSSNELTSIHLTDFAGGTTDSCEIILKVDNAKSPKTLGLSGDARELGIALYQIDLE